MVITENNYPNHVISINNQTYPCKAAGILPYTIINNKLFFLLQKSSKNTSLYSDFGGKRERSDKNSMYTAAREFSEETNGIFFNNKKFNNINNHIKTSTIITESLLMKQLPLYIYNFNGKYLIYMLYVYPIRIQQLGDTEIHANLKRSCEWIDGKMLINDEFINTQLQYRLRKGLKKTIFKLIFFLEQKKFLQK